MPITINGTGTIAGISVGGLENGCVNEADLATAAVTNTKLASGAVTPDKLATTIVGPAFSAYNNAAQTLTNSVETKVILNTEEFDTASAFDSTTNYRFQPAVAGYYQFNAIIRPKGSTNFSIAYCALWKNGSSFVRGTEWNGVTTAQTLQLQTNYLVYLNGSTDYIELYAFIFGSGTLTLDSAGTAFTSRLSGFLARPA